MKKRAAKIGARITTIDDTDDGMREKRIIIRIMGRMIGWSVVDVLQIDLLIHLINALIN